MTRLIRLVCLLVGLFWAPLGAAQTHGWIRDFDTAAALAKAEGKHLIVVFFGSDWSAHSQELWAEVLGDPRWLGALETRFVAAQLDFPYSAAAKDQVPNLARNRELQLQYGVRVFPRLLVMRPDGRAYAELGWLPLGPVEHLAEFERIVLAGQTALGQLEQLEGEFCAADTVAERQAALGRSLSQLEAPAPLGTLCERLIGPLIELCREAFALDPKGEAGLAQRALTGCLRYGVFGEDVAQAALRFDPEGRLGQLFRLFEIELSAARDAQKARVFAERVLGFLRRVPEPPDLQRLTSIAAQAAFWCADPELINDPSLARELGERALELDGEQARQLGVQRLLDGLGDASILGYSER